MKRPTGILFEWFDPFDRQTLCTTQMSYEPRKAAKGYYTDYVKRFTDGYKSLFSDVLEGRAPSVKVTLQP